MAEKKEEIKSKNEFLISLITFYKKTLCEASSSVLALKDIQEKFPSEYKDLVDLQNDPSVLLEISQKMDPESSKILIEIFVKASALSAKMNKLFELSIEEKDKLAKGLKDFSINIENSLKLLQTKPKK